MATASKPLKEKIANIQQSIDGLTKEGFNPHFKSGHVTLNQIIDALRPLELEYKISITMPLAEVNGRPALMLRISDLEAETNSFVQEVIPLPDIADPQKMGSAITYYRRYMLMAFFNLKAEDDDGNSASGHVTQPVTRTSTKPSPNRSIQDRNDDPLSLD